MLLFSFCAGRETRLITQRAIGNFGHEGFQPRPELGLLSENRLPPDLSDRYVQTVGNLNSVINRMDAARLSPEAIALMRQGRMGRYPDGYRPMWPVMRETNMVSPYLSNSPSNRLPWTFVPPGWRQNQPTFVPGVGMGMAPYGVPPAYRPMLYTSVPYPLPNTPYRLPAFGPQPSLRPTDPLLWDQRTAFAPIPRPPLLPPPPPDPRRTPMAPLPQPVAPVVPFAFAASAASIGAPAQLPRLPETMTTPRPADIEFTYDGPSQTITLNVDNGARQISVSALPEDGQTMRYDAGFAITRQGNRYRVVFGQN